MRLALISVPFLIAPAHPSLAEVSTSDPLWDWKYDAVERLTLAFGERTVSNARPMSRLEMAGIVLRLAAKAGAEDDYYRVLLKRLEDDLKDEIESINNRTTRDLKIKPLRWVRIKAVHSDEPFHLENDYGFNAGDFSARGEASTSGAWGFAGYELRPQYSFFRDDEEDDELRLHSGYLVMWLKDLEVEVGKDALWWGPGRHGAWLLTNNAPAFELIKLSNAAAAVPPGFLRIMGDTKLIAFLGRLSEQKITYIYKGARVEEEKNPLFAGFRLDLSPSKYLEVGLSQTTQFIDRGGRGYSLGYIKDVFISSHEANDRELTEGAVANRLGSVDASLKIDGSYDFMKSLGLKGMKLYLEHGGETMNDANALNFPYFANVGNLFGLYLDTGSAEFRVEYASNFMSSAKWYEGHYQFTGGYKNEGFIIGHHQGGHSRDLFLYLSYPFADNLAAALYFDREEWKTKGARPGWLSREDISGMAVDVFSERGRSVKLSYEYRDGDNPEVINHVWAVEGLWRF